MSLLSYLFFWRESLEDKVWIVENIKNTTRFRILFPGVSGSDQPTINRIIELNRKFDDYKLCIVDLRQESHGFIDSTPVSWYKINNSCNWGKETNEIELGEMSLLDSIKPGDKVPVYQLKKQSDVKIGADQKEIVVEYNPLAEYNVCDILNVDYKRIPVPDSQRPSNEVVDRFIRWLRSVDEEKVWIHFHCECGKGRTTTFMAMIDMMMYGSELTFDEILNRQTVIGGSDLKKTESTNQLKHGWKVERFEFIKNYYRYCCEVDWTRTLWSEWTTEHLQ